MKPVSITSYRCSNLEKVPVCSKEDIGILQEEFFVDFINKFTRILLFRMLNLDLQTANGRCGFQAFPQLSSIHIE